MAIAEKLEIVEKQIRETVAGTQSAIDDVVTNVKGTVSDTTEFSSGLSTCPIKLAGIPGWLRQRRIGRFFARRSRRIKRESSKKIALNVAISMVINAEGSQAEC